MFRAFISIVFAVFFLIVTLPLLGILALVGLFSSRTRERASMAIIRWAFRVLLVLAGMKLTVYGRENIPRERAALFVGNHRSIYDISAAYTLLPPPAGIVAKDSLAKIPIFAIWERFICCLFLNRDDLRSGMEMIKRGTEQLTRGISMYICPEGTRNKAEKDIPLLPFHEGSFRMATKCDAPVVPIAIANAIQVLQTRPLRLVPTEVVVTICPPIETAALDRSEKKQLGATCKQIMEEALSGLETLE